MLAKQIMRRKFVTVSPQTSVKSLSVVLGKSHARCALVIDHERRLCGLVTEADIVRKRGKYVKEIMAEDIPCLEPTASVERIAALMSAYELKHLAVVKDRRLVGMVCQEDLIMALAGGHYDLFLRPAYDL